ncbi:MAG: hypothetical protein M1608_08115 [Candidatus Omnitrophica bacterium]|nr:hypothetical protein [Candidatus Omnitrophota bacterium]
MKRATFILRRRFSLGNLLKEVLALLVARQITIGLNSRAPKTRSSAQTNRLDLPPAGVNRQNIVASAAVPGSMSLAE